MSTMTPMPAKTPLLSRRSFWMRLLLSLAAIAIAILVFVVFIDDDDSTAEFVPRVAGNVQVNSVAPPAMVSADAIEQWTSGTTVPGTVDGGSGSAGITSADAAEHQAQLEAGAEAETCTSGTTSADAAERCLNEG
jgi:hypothetical protein